MNYILIGILIIIGSFILSFIIAPIFLMFSTIHAAMVYTISWVLFIIGIIIGGKIAYNRSMKRLKKVIGQK